jgi:hypothetical protein
MKVAVEVISFFLITIPESEVGLVLLAWAATLELANKSSPARGMRKRLLNPLFMRYPHNEIAGSYLMHMNAV